MTSGVADLTFFALALFVVSTVGGVRVITKAGYSVWLALLFVIPVVDLIILLVIAFSKWPVQRRLEQAQRRSPAKQVPDSGLVPTAAPRTGRQGTSWGWSQPFGGSWDPISASR